MNKEDQLTINFAPHWYRLGGTVELDPGAHLPYPRSTNKVSTPTSAKHTTELYFEAHVTVAPVESLELERMRALCNLCAFRVADLLMVKGGVASSSTKDTFCTGRGDVYEELKGRTIGLVSCLTTFGFKVWRYKIENTLLDVRLPR